MAIGPIISGIMRLATGLIAGSARGKAARAAMGAFSLKHGADKPPIGSSGKRATPPAAREGDKERMLDRLWKYDTGWALAERMTSLIGSTQPTFIHAITVSVIGGPGADLRRVWYLACAAAFGRWRNRVKGIGEANMEAVWDVTGKGAKVSIAYAISGMAGQLSGISATQVLDVGIASAIPGGVSLVAVTGGGPIKLVKDGVDALRGIRRDAGAGAPPIADGPRGGIDLLQQGPTQVTIGDGWPLWLRRSPDARALPDEILRGTGSYTQFAAVNEECDKDTVVRAFKFARHIDVTGEEKSNDGNRQRYPYGQIIPAGVAISNGGLGPFASRDSVRFRGRDYTTTPLLPDDGRVITTGEKRDARVQPPRPWVDGKTRSSVVAMITAALHQPCYAPSAVPCSTIPLGASAGFRNYPAGAPSIDPNHFTYPFPIDETVTKVEVPRLGE